jgi:3-hydroxyacyl-CoA dehydrogenase
MIDQLGVDWFVERLREEGREVPSLLLFAAGRTFYRVSRGTKEYLSVQGIYMPIVRPEGVLLLEDVRRRSAPVLKNESACLWDVGDGVLCFEFYTKMNTFDMGTFSLLRESMHLIENNRDKYKGMVIYNEGPHFSCGANINFFILLMETKQWDVYDQLLQVGQEVFRDLAQANFPIVAAPSGFAIGGGCEIILHCTAIQAYAEANIGLVETGIGVVPAWGGTMRMVRRAFERDLTTSTPAQQMIRVFDTIGNARISKTAFEARDFGYLRSTDGVTMNRDRLLFDAKCKLLELAENFVPQRAAAFDFKAHETRIYLKATTAGDLAAGKIGKHDARVRNSLATVLTDDEGMGFGPMTEQRLRDLERREFIELCKTKETYDRVVYTLKTGKHLKN